MNFAGLRKLIVEIENLRETKKSCQFTSINVYNIHLNLIIRLAFWWYKSDNGAQH